jgi:hypothetical protein
MSGRNNTSQLPNNHTNVKHLWSTEQQKQYPNNAFIFNEKSINDRKVRRSLQRFLLSSSVRESRQNHSPVNEEPHPRRLSLLHNDDSGPSPQTIPSIDNPPDQINSPSLISHTSPHLRQPIRPTSSLIGQYSQKCRITSPQKAYLCSTLVNLTTTPNAAG